jgi:hypothetical protein
LGRLKTHATPSFIHCRRNRNPGSDLFTDVDLFPSFAWPSANDACARSFSHAHFYAHHYTIQYACAHHNAITYPYAHHYAHFLASGSNEGCF